MSAPGGSSRSHLAEEVLRFLVVGGLATAVSVGGFNALVHGALIGSAPLGQRPVTAFVIVNVLAGLVAYAGMRVWAFRHRQVNRPVRSLLRFFVLGALTMAIPIVCLAVSRYLLGRSDPWSDNIAANVVGLGVGTATRFWAFRRYVFVDPEESPAEPIRA